MKPGLRGLLVSSVTCAMVLVAAGRMNRQACLIWIIYKPKVGETVSMVAKAFAVPGCRGVWVHGTVCRAVEGTPAS